MDFTKNLITDVFKAYFYVDGKLVFTSKNLTKGGISNSLSSEEVRNGIGNGLFALLQSDKSADITLGENTFNFSTLAMLAGTQITTGAGIGYTEEITLKADTAKSITLPKAPLAGAKVSTYLNGKEVTGTLTGSKVTFTTGVAENDEIVVYPYKITTAETTETIKINAGETIRGGELVLKTKEVSANKKVVADIEIICPNCMPTGEWSIDTTSQVQANEQELGMKVMQYNSDGDLYFINRLPRA